MFSKSLTKASWTPCVYKSPKHEKFTIFYTYRAKRSISQKPFYLANRRMKLYINKISQILKLLIASLRIPGTCWFTLSNTGSIIVRLHYSILIEPVLHCQTCRYEPGLDPLCVLAMGICHDLIFIYISRFNIFISFYFSSIFICLIWYLSRCWVPMKLVLLKIYVKFLSFLSSKSEILKIFSKRCVTPKTKKNFSNIRNI